MFYRKWSRAAQSKHLKKNQHELVHFVCELSSKFKIVNYDRDPVHLTVCEPKCEPLLWSVWMCSTLAPNYSRAKLQFSGPSSALNNMLCFQGQGDFQAVVPLKMHPTLKSLENIMKCIYKIGNLNSSGFYVLILLSFLGRLLYYCFEYD